MKKFISGLMIGSILACAGSSVAQEVNDEIDSSNDPGELNDSEFDKITIDGMPCIIWKDKRDSSNASYAYSGLTCDWRDR